VRAWGNVGLERFLYDLRPNLSRFNTITVITPSRRTEWVTAMAALRRQGVTVGAVYIDPVEFGASPQVEPPLQALFTNEIPAYMIKRGQTVNEALRAPLQALFTNEIPAYMIKRGQTVNEALRAPLQVDLGSLQPPPSPEPVGVEVGNA
jgi:hypothetical protein